MILSDSSIIAMIKVFTIITKYVWLEFSKDSIVFKYIRVFWPTPRKYLKVCAKRSECVKEKMKLKAEQVRYQWRRTIVNGDRVNKYFG